MTEERKLSMEELAWIRGMTRRRLSRRDLLRYAGRGAGALGVSAFLAACGVGGTERRETSSPGQTLEPLPPQTGALNMANWPAYIDLDMGKSQTLIDFRDRFDIDIDYKVEISGNDEFFGTDLQPLLAQGQPTGWDIVVLTDWMIAKCISLGYLQELHRDALPNVEANLADRFRNLYHDPENAYSVPWAAGLVGIGYNRALTGRDITSVEDLFDPAFAGHVGMFLEMRDTFNFMFYLLGVEPEQATLADVEEAGRMLQQQRDDGIVRNYYGNDYLSPLGTGDLWVTMAWSGDVFSLSLDNPDLQFVVPKEGGNRLIDNMCIPILAEHVTDAHTYMNYVYDPQVAKLITEWVWYESPVEGVQELVRQDAQGPNAGDLSCSPICQDLAESPLVWPTEESLAEIHGYKLLDLEEEAAWHDVFDPIAQG